MPRKKEEPVRVEVVEKKRKSSANATSFKKGNPYRFRPADPRISPGGKVKARGGELLSKALRVTLSDRAPSLVCQALNLPSHSSVAMCLAKRLEYMAVQGNLEALKMIHEFTEGSRSRLDVFGLYDMPNPDTVPPLLTVVFEESDGNGHRKPAPIIEGDRPPLPDVTD